jgi:hypothetical protein
MPRYSARLVSLLILCLLALPGCDLIPGPSGTPVPLLTPSAEPDASPTAASQLPPGCLAGDMEGLAGWQGATGAMSGAVFLVNKGTEPCTLQGRPGIHIVGPNGAMLPITDVEMSGESTPCCPPVILVPGSRAIAGFVWRNWCGEAQGPFSLAVALPGEGGQLNVAVLDRSGTPVVDTPRCDNSQEASTIAVGQFAKAPSP